jgi:hypothetical protein
MIVVGRSEHPFMSICDLHEQLILRIDKMKIVVIFASYFLTPTRADSHSWVVIRYHHDFNSRIWSS